jgi:diaminopimelate decarboxylase
MAVFAYRNGVMYAEETSVADLAARFGTPLYIYSRTHLLDQYRGLTEAMKAVSPQIYFAVKSNSNLAVIATLAGQGAGADVVSGGELFRARRAGVPSSRIVFAGVGKTVAEIDYALNEEIRFFTVESEPELERIAERAVALGKVGRIAIRVNPDVDPHTHKYTSTGKAENKFGVDLARAELVYRRALQLPGIEVAGLHMHLGSPIMTPTPYAEALEKVRPLCEMLRQEVPTFRHLDIGGGLGISYRPEQAPLDPRDFAAAVLPALHGLDLEIGMEPGRYFTGNAGILVTRVEYVKENPFKKFVIIDAAMNDLLRPPLYQAHHEILPVTQTTEQVFGDVVGPVCESGDFMAQNRELPAVAAGELLAIMSAGAYGFVMASNYNTRGRAAEVMVAGDRVELIRQRETWEELVAGERVPDWSGTDDGNREERE